MNLTELPAVVLWELSKYLDPATYKSARLVCRAWKNWVDYSNANLKMNIYIRNQLVFPTILESQIKWNNITVSDLIPSNELIPYLHQVKPFLRRLCIRNFGFTNGNPRYLHQILQALGPQLHSLHFCSKFRISANSYLLNSVELKNQVRAEARVLLKQNLSGLRDLQFNVIYDIGKSEAFADLLFVFLKLCTNLTSLGLPLFQKENGAQPNVDWNQQNAQVQALTHYLNSANSGDSKHENFSKLKSIHFFEERNIELYCPRTFTLVAGVTEEALARLVVICNRLGTKLFNVPTNALPWISSTYRLNAEDDLEFRQKLQMYHNTIQSTISTDNFFGIDQRFISSKCKVKVVHFFKSAQIAPEYVLPERLTIEQVDLKFSCRNQEPIHKLFSRARPTVVELKLIEIQEWLVVNSLHFGLARAFPNLKVLWMSGWNTRFSVDALKVVEGLEKLECLTFKGLQLLGWFGTEYELSRKLKMVLKNLKSIKIDNCEILKNKRHAWMT